MHEFHYATIISLAYSCPMSIRETMHKSYGTRFKNSRLTASDICRNMQRDVVYDPKEEHGLDFTNIYIYQGTQHIEYYVNHILDKN